MTFAYYFCDNSDAKRNTATAIIRGLLLQILRQQHALFKHIQPEFNERKIGLFNDIDALWRILTSMLKDPEAGEVYLLVDALDECEESSRNAFVYYVKNLFSTPNLLDKIRVKFLICSRPGLGFEENFDGTVNTKTSKCLRVDSGSINEDLSKVIDTKVAEISKRWSLRLIEKVKTSLKQKAGGTFLWVSLILHELSRTRQSEIENKLESLPDTLQDIFGRILREIKEEDQRHAIFILHCVMVAEQPLTVTELAMACKLGPRKWEESFLPLSEDLEDLKNEWECCGPLLRLDYGRGSPTVNIIHQSVKDFLMGTEIQVRPDLLKYHIRGDMAHLTLFRVCWDFLCKTDFDQFSSNIVSKNDILSNWGEAQNTYWQEVEKGETIFLSYTARAWDEHAIGAGNV
ncbi:hypothetical protein LTR28_012523, partial [Elasticomyces elasticus]